MSTEMWWNLDGARVGAQIINTVRRIEIVQAEQFERFRKLEVLYDPNSPTISADDVPRGNMQENVVASNVDTIHAAIAVDDIRPRVMTDGADWHQQRRARALELYAEEQKKLLGVMSKCRASFKEGAKKGNGLVKVVQRFKQPVVEHVMVENIVVDQNETRDHKPPTQMHEWVSTDADALSAEYPRAKKAIMAARAQRQMWRVNTRVFPAVDNEVQYIHSFRLPIGKPDRDGRYLVRGREVKTLPDGKTLIDRPYDKPFFPYAVFMWSVRPTSWYAISGAERIAGIQRALNKRNWQIEKANDNIALPITFTRPADANLNVKTSRIGQHAVVKGDYPQVFTPIAVAAETYKSRLDLLDSGNREFGQSQMATHGTKPAGLDSGAALREFHDQTSDRHSPQQKDFEDHVMDVIWLVLDVCKDLDKDAPTMIRQGRFGRKKLVWKDVDMGEVKFQLVAASGLPRTAAGREQFVLDLAQAGVISQASVTRLIDHPDIESELSLYQAAIENAEECLDLIAEGETIIPEPYMNAGMCRWRGDNEYLKWWKSGAPEARMEALRQFVVIAAYIEAGGPAAANQSAGAQPGAAAAPPGAMTGPAGPPGAPGMPSGPISTAPPGAGPPVAAFSPQAMQLRAGTG